MRESDLFLPLKSYFEKSGHEVFAEVNLYSGMGTPRADIVTRHGACVCVVEMKLKVNMEVVIQAAKWRGKANYSYIAVPYRGYNYDSFKILRELGIGLISVQEYGSKTHPHTEIRTHVNPRFYRRTSVDWKDLLQSYYQDTVAGTNRIVASKYQYMMQEIRNYMDRRQSQELVSIEELLVFAEKHYANPKNSLVAALIKYEHKWIEKIKVGRKIYFKLTDKE